MRHIFTGFILLFFIFSGCSKGTLYQASSKGNVEKVKTFIQKGTNVNQRGEFGLTPLMAAAKSNNFRVIKTLLANGANINAKDDFRRTAIWYAYDYESFDAFKLLLESGAIIDFQLTYEQAPTLYKKRNLYKLAKEYTLLGKIKKNQNDLRLFNLYFSEFSNGYYASEVEAIFEEMIRADYQEIESSTNVLALQRFIDKYSALNQKYYIVIAEPLNIRAGNATNAKKLGEYANGDKIYALTEKDGWIQTDKGWVTKTYLKPVTESISIFSGYIRKIDEKLNQLKEKKTEKTKLQQIEEQRRRIEEKTEQVEKELDRILRNAKLSDLESFINKYKDKREYRSLVNKAKDAYKKILIGDY